MKRPPTLRRTITALALAGSAAAAFTVPHMMRPNPDWSGGLHPPTSIAQLDTKTQPNPEFGAG